ncbi:hypothetical protein EV179_000613 [Coemansia sp. RSA 487]|nr:hypothetical protein EV179_000613 [Coemansia sp. RSA 487]
MYSSVHTATALPICSAGSSGSPIVHSRKYSLVSSGASSVWSIGHCLISGSGYACRYQAASRFVTGIFPNRSLYPRERSYKSTDRISTGLWIEKYKTDLISHRETMSEEASHAKVIDGKIVAVFKELEQVKVDTQAFNMPYASEQAAIPARIEKAQDELRKAQLQSE